MISTLSQRVKQSDDVLFQEVANEAVLLDLASEKYFGLDPIGTRIWMLMGEDASLQRIHAMLCVEYDVDSTTLESDLLALIGELAEAGLVTVEK